MNNTKINIEYINLDELKKLINKAKTQVEQLEKTVTELSEFEPKIKNLES
ncbi:hypothetical protein [Carnobacterium antarcticum]|uniref:Uncharacterized protein n=1 Tax=Carnobacterium antarcticum TaxID=2126436 RepID=A0ABW4NMA9_9LACT|nr:hypothetical protein [Carnobacterium sp. CP1]ALV21026.1 hypothetical protein NY10_406 [Carnobacterium sp. CP1]